jgi:hypothetical protein
MPLMDPVKNLQNPLTHHGQNSLAMRNASIYHVGADSKPMSAWYTSRILRCEPAPTRDRVLGQSTRGAGQDPGLDERRRRGN